MDLPTYTNIWRIEKRLYKLYDLRLPMPLPIVWIGVFVGVFVPWSLLLVLIGVPVEMPWHVLFLVPPGIVTWLSTRPVIEGKRLTELLESQLRYLGEPKAWYRLAPSSEPDVVTFSGRVWRAAPRRAKATKATRAGKVAKTARKERQAERRRAGRPVTGPRQVRPAVAAAAAAASQAPVAEPTSARTGWGSRRGTAPALKASGLPAGTGAGGGSVRREEGLSGGSGRAQELQEPVPLVDEVVGTARRTGATDRAVPRDADHAVLPDLDDFTEPADFEPDTPREGTPDASGGATRDFEPDAFGGATRDSEADTSGDAAHSSDSARASDRGTGSPTRGTPVGGSSAGGSSARGSSVGGKPIDTEALRRLRKLAASADAPSESAGRADPAARADAAPRAEDDARTQDARHEEEIARDQHRRGQPPRLNPALLLSGTHRVWPPLNANAKPAPRPSRREDADQTARPTETARDTTTDLTPTATDAPVGPADATHAPADATSARADVAGGPNEATSARADVAGGPKEATGARAAVASDAAAGGPAKGTVGPAEHDALPPLPKMPVDESRPRERAVAGEVPARTPAHDTTPADGTDGGRAIGEDAEPATEPATEPDTAQPDSAQDVVLRTGEQQVAPAEDGADDARSATASESRVDDGQRDVSSQQRADDGRLEAPAKARTNDGRSAAASESRVGDDQRDAGSEAGDGERGASTADPAGDLRDAPVAEQAGPDRQKDAAVEPSPATSDPGERTVEPAVAETVEDDQADREAAPAAVAARAEAAGEHETPSVTAAEETVSHPAGAAAPEGRGEHAAEPTDGEQAPQAAEGEQPATTVRGRSRSAAGRKAAAERAVAGSEPGTAGRSAAGDEPEAAGRSVAGGEPEAAGQWVAGGEPDAAERAVAAREVAVREAEAVEARVIPLERERRAHREAAVERSGEAARERPRRAADSQESGRGAAAQESGRGAARQAEAGGRQAEAGDRQAGREAARHTEADGRQAGRQVARQRGDVAAPVPGPRAGEGRVRRVESVVGRDSGGWRRIAQVVVGGASVRTDGSELDEARAKAVFSGSRRIVVLGCTGGAGQSTTALMLGHTFAQYRDDRVVAVDASTGGGGLTSKIEPETPETLTSLLSGLDRVSGYLTMRGYTTRTASGLEVISADTDAGAEQRLADRSFFSDRRIGESMRLLDRHYKLAVIDPAASLAARLLPYADQLVLVVPASEEAPEAVAMTYEWLDGHGCAELRRRAVMVVNGVSRRSMADVEQAESVARGRCRAIVRVPWEDDLAPGGAEVVDPGQLRAAGRRAYLALAGVVVAGFAAQTVRPSEEEMASDPPGTRIGER
ncbi:TcpE family conjugal transfer membrane protein [Nonomuraea fastidiosa]|uniref:TcpE family conjugal transfer membrane protein n=1 Tax=Nonomuraea TaxID=83681 RepID=UPI00341ACAF5